VDETVGRGDGAFLDQVRPELARQVELGVDLERPGDLDGPIGALRRVVQLAIGSMAGTGIVPGGRALLRLARHALDYLQSEIGFQLLKEDAERGAHDAGAHQYNVGLFVTHRVAPALNGTSAPGARTT